MVKIEDRLSFGETCRIAQEAFIKFNGWINPTFKASRLIFDNNNDTILAMALGNIIVFFPHNVLKFYYETMNIDFTKEQIKSCIVFLIVHELSHLEQDLALYESQYKDNPEKLEEMVEGSNNANTYNYLLAAKNNHILEDDINIMWPGFWHTVLKDDKTYKKYLDEYYRVPSSVKKVIYCLSLLCMDFNQLSKILDEYLNVAVEYSVQDKFVFKEMIKMNGMFIHPDIVMNRVVNRIVLDVYSGFNTAFYSRVSVKKESKDFITLYINNTQKPELKEVVYRIKNEEGLL